MRRPALVALATALAAPLLTAGVALASSVLELNDGSSYVADFTFRR